MQWTVKINYQSVDELSSTTSLYAFKRASLFFRISIAILLFPHVLENYVTVFCAHDHMTHFVYDGRKLSRTSTKNFQEADILQKLSDRYWFCFSFDWYFHNISFYYCFLYLIFSLEMNTWNDIILRHSFQSKKKNHVMSASNVPASARKYYVLMPVIRQKLSELNVAKILFEWHIWNTYINKAFGDFVSIIFFFLLWVPLGFLLQLSWNLFSINQLTVILLLVNDIHCISYFTWPGLWLILLFNFNYKMIPQTVMQ